MGSESAWGRKLKLETPTGKDQTEGVVVQGSCHGLCALYEIIFRKLTYTLVLPTDLPPCPRDTDGTPRFRLRNLGTHGVRRPRVEHGPEDRVVEEQTKASSERPSPLPAPIPQPGLRTEWHSPSFPRFHWGRSLTPFGRGSRVLGHVGAPRCRVAYVTDPGPGVGTPGSSHRRWPSHPCSERTFRGRSRVPWRRREGEVPTQTVDGPTGSRGQDWFVSLCDFGSTDQTSVRRWNSAVDP